MRLLYIEKMNRRPSPFPDSSPKNAVFITSCSREDKIPFSHYLNIAGDQESHALISSLPHEVLDAHPISFRAAECRPIIRRDPHEELS